MKKHNFSQNKSATGICLKFFFFLSILMVTRACTNDSAYSARVTVDMDGWHFSEPCTFSPGITDTAEQYAVSIWVRHGKEYKYSNLWLKFISSGDDLVADTLDLVEIQLADKTGRWLGKCSRSLCTKSVTILTDHRFSEAQNFKLDVYQYMREDELKGVNSIGINIHPSLEEEAAL